MSRGNSLSDELEITIDTWHPSLGVSGRALDSGGQKRGFNFPGLCFVLFVLGGWVARRIGTSTSIVGAWVTLPRYVTVAFSPLVPQRTTTIVRVLRARRFPQERNIVKQTRVGVSATYTYIYTE